MAAGAAVLLLLGFLAAYEYSKTVTKCEINTSPTGPLLVTSIGTRTILSDYSGLIERNISEKIQFYCGTGLIFKRDGVTQLISENTTETLSCQPDGSFLFQNNEIRISKGKTSVECISGVAGMYESRISLPNCKDHTTLLLGHDFQEMGSIKSAAMCYDIAAVQLKYISYTTYPTRNRLLEKSQIGQLGKLGFDINVNASDRFLKAARCV